MSSAQQSSVVVVAIRAPHSVSVESIQNTIENIGLRTFRHREEPIPPVSVRLPKFQSDGRTVYFLAWSEDIDAALRGTVGFLLKRHYAEDVWWSSGQAMTARMAGEIFPGFAHVETPDSVSARESFSESLEPVLVRGLTELCNRKPPEPLRWLAEYLLAQPEAAG
eukprot:TRINITY_DN1855_c0_g2_i1.p1 TRINITY_DN1855_c0_g2~~TRINITY_DN1855_c0_g2_i1.p1  ORF type:complete len:165 (+),score=18.04 TRINITY_DN1855_c0_g2_i1:191-685(+)